MESMADPSASPPKSIPESISNVLPPDPTTIGSKEFTRSAVPIPYRVTGSPVPAPVDASSGSDTSSSDVNV